MTPMRPPIEFFAHGTPKAQPRVRAYRRGNRAGVYDPGTAEEWKFRIREAARQAWDGTPLSGPIEANLTFWFPRPKGHWRTGKNSNQLRDDSPRALHAQKPDRDNLEKAVLDALSGLGIWADDSQVCCGHVRKLWAILEQAGCQVTIRELADE